MRATIAQFEVDERRMSLSELDRVAGQEATGEGIRTVWRKFVALAGPDLTAVLSSRPVDSRRLADIYRARAETQRRTGQEGDGFEQSVCALETRQGPVSLAYLEPHHYFGVCFLTPELDRLIGFVYVRNVGDSAR
jgi:hypothetical protein